MSKNFLDFILGTLDSILNILTNESNYRPPILIIYKTLVIIFSCIVKQTLPSASYDEGERHETKMSWASLQGIGKCYGFELKISLFGSFLFWTTFPSQPRFQYFV